jgi:hypothetical protein
MDRLWNVHIPHYDVTPTFGCALALMFIVAFIMGLLGYAMLAEANHMNNFNVRYDHICEKVRGTGKACKVYFAPDKDLVNPIIYYRLDKFYNNYRTFAKSQDRYQMRGKEKKLEEAKKCIGQKTYGEIMMDGDNWFPLSVTKNFTKFKDELAYPCGSIAKYFFTDKFTTLRSRDGSLNVNIDDSNIAFEIDKNKKFKINKDVWNRGQYYRNVEDEHFMVWYQVESSPDFIKLYGRIEGILLANQQYEITVYDDYNSTTIGNNKFIFFSEVGRFGGKNKVLPIIFIATASVIGGSVFLFGLLFFYKMPDSNEMEQDDYIESLKY